MGARGAVYGVRAVRRVGVLVWSAGNDDIQHRDGPGPVWASTTVRSWMSVGSGETYGVPAPVTRMLACLRGFACRFTLLRP